MATKLENDADEKAAAFLTDQDRLVFLLEELTRRLRRTFDTSLEQFGLTRTQWRALAYLYRTPGMTQTELAGQLELERASIGQAIDRLENLGLVERRSAEDDRRVWQVHLQPDAIDLLPKMRVEADQVYERLLEGIKDEDLEAFKSTLATMQRNLGDA
ncbi:MarR family winged helix-turn-helix transcriptional regulator [Altererythrobacter rubellus]|uniref:MarR family transcriptional regulator n=1 Tax=Altererythrobacter rubellus TaxID=2173831 RepID=A0A9Y2F8X8_9SPHN|nr:MarR family transcriptional regulator [Altererythrobacter rubellus]WIW95411.1 MarR family transcriptional regulator [Altererythrobacter rubellus]